MFYEHCILFFYQMGLMRKMRNYSFLTWFLNFAQQFEQISTKMNLTDQLFRNHLDTVSFQLLLILTILIFCNCIIHEVVHFHCLIKGHCVLWRTSHWLKIGTYIVKIKLCLKLIFWWCDALIYGFFSTFNVGYNIKFGFC